MSFESKLPLSRNETDAIALAGKTMGDRAANPGGSAGDDDGASGMFHATQRGTR